MTEKTNGYIKTSVFTIIVVIAMAVISGAVTMAVSALSKSNTNELKIQGVEIREELHYNELKGIVEKFDAKLDELLKKK